MVFIRHTRDEAWMMISMLEHIILGSSYSLIISFHMTDLINLPIYLVISKCCTLYL